MEQIKTIIKRATEPEAFDNEVNAALAEGYFLVRRCVVQAVQGITTEYHRCLYAELVRTVFSEAGQCCENCAHTSKKGFEEPCASCSDDCDKWEPAEA